MTIELANRLQKLRKEHGYTQDTLADALGVSRQAVSKWECTEASPDTDNLIAIARLYGITLDELVYGKDEPKVEEKTEETKEEFADDETDDADDFKDDDDDKDGTKVHIGTDGIHVTSDDGTKVHLDGVHIYVNRQDLDKKHFKTGKIVGATTGIAAIACVAAYILLGALLNLWHPAWIIFLAIPVIPSLVEAILKREASKFAFPIFVTAIYLVLGCVFGYWHPGWTVFLTIPVYYIVLDLIKRK